MSLKIDIILIFLTILSIFNRKLSLNLLSNILKKRLKLVLLRLQKRKILGIDNLINVFMLKSFDLREIKGFKKIFNNFFDIILFNASFWISYNIRDDLFLIPTKNQFIHLLIGNFLFLFFYIYFEMNNFVTRYFDLDYIKSFIKFLSIFFLIYFSISFFYQMNGIPRSSPLIISLVYFSLVVVTRYLILNIFKYNDVKNKKKIVVIGDGEKAYNFYKSLSLNPIPEPH